MKIVASIEARMDASRLPGKILKDILGKPMLERLVDRVRGSKWIHEVVVATTVAPGDEATLAACRKMGVACFRGSSEDVLDRVLKAAQTHDADLIVELTGDCPLLDPHVIDSVIQFYLDHEYDYVSNILERTYPRGLDTQIFSVEVLEEVARLTQDPTDHEHVSLYIYNHAEQFHLGNVPAPEEVRRPELRLTVDTADDLTLIREIYGRLYPVDPVFTLQDVVRLLDRAPDLKEINAHISQKPVR